MKTSAGQIDSIKYNTVMGRIMIFILTIVSGMSVLGQDAPDPQIEGAVQSFFEAMRTGDTLALTEILPLDCKMQTIEQEEGRVVVKDGKRDQFVSVVERLAGKLDEQIDNLIIHQDRAMATAWMDYEFYFEGDKHHCGVNAMTMVLREGQWQIIYICDTRGPCL